MDTNELAQILAEHKTWLMDNDQGKRAYLRGADLSKAYLSGAYLSEAYLSGADLRGADLSKAIGIVSIGPGGSRGDMLYAVIWPDCVMVKAGCFWDTLDAFVAAVNETHKDNQQHREYYLAVVELIKIWEKGQL
jgi:hypothetical protein